MFVPVPTLPAHGPDSARQLYCPTEIEWPSRSPSASGGPPPINWQAQTVVFSCATALGAKAANARAAAAEPLKRRKFCIKRLPLRPCAFEIAITAAIFLMEP